MQRALSDGKCREGEYHLDYKNCPEVIARLEKRWHTAHATAAKIIPAMSAPKLGSCLVLLNGYPGSGKLAIARELRSKLQNVQCRLIDNHLMIDPVDAIYPHRGPEHRALHNRLRQSILDELRAFPGDNVAFIMTVCLGSNAEDLAVYAQHLDVST